MNLPNRALEFFLRMSREAIRFRVTGGRILWQHRVGEKGQTGRMRCNMFIPRIKHEFEQDVCTICGALIDWEKR